MGWVTSRLHVKITDFEMTLGRLPGMGPLGRRVHARLVARRARRALQDIEWYQAGANAPGRDEKVEIDLPDVVRLFPDFQEMEQEYHARTKVWPIMHIIALRRHLLDQHPWLARNLYNAFLESKRRSIERLLDPAVSRYPLPWLPTPSSSSSATRGNRASRTAT
jgi:hypothetical protein